MSQVSSAQLYKFLQLDRYIEHDPKFNALNAELHSIRERLDDQAALATAKEHVARIREALDEANSSI